MILTTLENVKADILAGKSKKIFYSSRTCWWTHLESDMLEATTQGELFAEANFQRMMNDPKVSEEDKKKFQGLHATIKKRGTQTPLDPTGAPLMETEEVNIFIEQCEKPEPETRYGRYGLETLMKAHHQNCEGGAFATWQSYNKLLAIQKGDFSAL